jgi:hypothetical protein
MSIAGEREAGGPAKHPVAPVKAPGAKAPANGVAHHGKGFSLNPGGEGPDAHDCEFERY